MDTLEGWMKNPDYVNAGFGDVQTIATTRSRTAASRSSSGRSAACYQQASFYANFWVNFQEDAEIGEDKRRVRVLPARHRARTSPPRSSAVASS
jgi:alpha-glucoside transport system substrate-binding protein